jgi:hypothetical protein
MSYEMTLLCDLRTGNPLDKKLCVSDARSKVAAPTISKTTSREALYALDLHAKNAGWQRLRRMAQPVKWACPVCLSHPGKI